MLDAAVTFGAIPSRFADLRGNDGSVSLAAYSTIARGVGDKAPLEMTKWFDSNYHYLVPEIGPETVFALSSARWVDEFVEAKAAGFVTRPVITGPLTFLYLAKASDEAKAGFEPISRLDDLLPVYAELLAGVQGRGRRVGPDRRAHPGGRHRRRPRRGARQRGTRLPVARRADRPPAALRRRADGLARRRAPGPRRHARRGDRHRPGPRRRSHGRRPGRQDHRRGRGRRPQHLAHRPRRGAREARGRRGARRAPSPSSTSTSLFHVPHTLKGEEHLGAELISWLAFADEKVAEIVDARHGAHRGRGRRRRRARRGPRGPRLAQGSPGHQPRRRARRPRGRHARRLRRVRPTPSASPLRRPASTFPSSRPRPSAPSPRPPRSARLAPRGPRAS